ncbi:MAG: OprD family outer membrane porin [Campylobacterota bacterium]|nr:OprD family outer membrane porin [Campylobacterota bacterium]
MKKIPLGFATVALIASSALQAGGDIKPDEEVTVIAAPNALADAFKNGTVSGQIRAGYIKHTLELSGEPDSFSTALGGQLKYETGKFYGFDFGVAFYTSHAIDALSGDEDEGKFDEGFTSVDGHYDLLAEAYLDYSYKDFKIRGGRHLIDTPYADSDDIRMTPNTFESILATYGYNDFTFIAAYLTRWQGPDAEEYEFVDLLDDGNGIALAAATYASETIEAGVWYYGADNNADVIYADAISTYTVFDGIDLTGGLQFASQSEKNNSGYDSSLYGAKAEIAFSGLTLGGAYVAIDVDEGKKYFAGFGGGVGFTNMQEYTAGTFTLSQSADSWKIAAVYDFSELGISGLTVGYDYGKLKGDKYGEIEEQDLVIAYAPSDEWDIELVYAKIEDVHKDIEADELGNPVDLSFDRLLVRANYNF